MKNIVLIPLIIVVACILATGCVGQIKKDNGSGNGSATPTHTFSAIVNNTDFPGSNATIKSGLNGTLIVSINSWDAELPLFIDNKSAGIVTMEKPLMIMLEEGNHTVKVCSGVICLKEDVEIKFAVQRVVDFTEQLKRDVGFPTPTARIIDYYRSGSGVAVVVEFINPSSKDLSMTAEVGVGYSFINDRSHQRGGESTRGKAVANVKAGQRQTYVLDLGFASGYSYIFDSPNLGLITIEDFE
jgi:hypothetical protein